MIEGILFLGLVAWGNTDFFNAKVENEANGYTYWEKLEPCRAPSDEPGVYSMPIETPIGNKYVCYKQTKRPQQ